MNSPLPPVIGVLILDRVRVAFALDLSTSGMVGTVPVECARLAGFDLLAVIINEVVTGGGEETLPVISVLAMDRVRVAFGLGLSL